jgi:putative transposase
MIQVQLKLRPTRVQDRTMRRWLWHLTGVYNWTVRKVDLDAKDGIYHSSFALKTMLRGHFKTMGIPSDVLGGAVLTAYNAWRKCFQRLARKPRLKGRRNALNSIALPHGASVRILSPSRIQVTGLGPVRFHRQAIPTGRITTVRIVLRASGWHACLFIKAEPKAIHASGNGSIGIDPGFGSLLTLSSGEHIENPREFRIVEGRIGQAQRGQRRQLTARLQERLKNRRKDRNHRLSRHLVSENTFIAWSKDNTVTIARMFGKSVGDAGHHQLRQMLAYKCRAGDGRTFVEVPSRNSTKTCSVCGRLSGPSGYSGLSVRQWTCGCGASHDRDINAAINTLIAGAGIAHERTGNSPSGIAI